MTSADKWKLVDELFHAALLLEPSHRKGFLQEKCNDPQVLREVESLLAAHSEAGGFIQTPIILEGLEEAEGETLAPGDVIGDYKIEREIGRGGMGAVYLASRADLAFEKHVAVKLLKRGMDTAEVLRHFRNERQILAAFDHPNIARLLDGGTSPSGVPYFVMEYVEGVPINEYCESRKLNVNDRLVIFQQVCAAVSYAHRHLVIHRDIKPSNILVTPEGIPKLLDFGIAKILHPDWQAGSTATGMHLMTPEYASPEQVLGLAVTTVSDVYALGVLLYELLTDQPPYRFEGRSPIEIARVIEDTQPPLPSESPNTAEPWKRRLRGDLDNIVAMALRKEPQRRYPSVEQFSEDIRRHLVGLPVVARKDTIAYRMTKFAQRNKIPVAAAILLLISLIAGVVATTWQAKKAKAQQARAEYANQFGDELRYVESLLLNMYSAPPHDTRPTIKLVRDRLQKMEKRMVQGGESAYGPGNHALGNSYLMLKDYELAKVHLEKAWDFGHREPSTAYALGKTLGALYLQSITNADQTSNRNRREQLIQEAETKYAQPAIRFLSGARNYAESPAYVEGLIALYQKRFDEALRKAKEALKSSSRPYEVIKLEGDIYFEMARMAILKGDASAVQFFSLSGDAYKRALETARSDPDIYLADVRRLTRTISYSVEEVLEPVTLALTLCDQAIKINPDDDRPYLAKAEVYIQQGINEMYYGSRDPRPAFRIAVAAAGEALKRKRTPMCHDRASNSYLRIAEYESAINVDPRDALNSSIAESEKALEVDSHFVNAYTSRASAYFYAGEYQLAHGEDPTSSYQKVIDTYEKDLQSIKRDQFSTNLLALTYLGFGEYRLQRGLDPRPQLNQAITHSLSGLRENPKATVFQDALGLAYVDLAKYEINNGVVPDKSFDLAIHHYDQALLHSAVYRLFNRAVAYLLRGAHKIRVRQDPKEDLNRAMEEFQQTIKEAEFAPALHQMASVHLLRARHQFINGKDPSVELNLGEKTMDQYFKENPSNPNAYLTQGLIHSLAGRWALKRGHVPRDSFDRAITQLQKCLELNRHEIEAHLELATIHRLRGNVDRGIQETMEAEKIYPQHPEALAIRSQLLRLKNQTKEADELLQRALSANPFLKYDYAIE